MNDIDLAYLFSVQGLWSWTVNQMLTPKFWVHLRREGFIKTWTRGHKASRHAHYVGGNRTDGYTKQVGEDDFGNRYYEDFDVDHKNQRRWVEFSDYFMQMWSNGDKVPVGWHGWLSHQYDDFPTRTGNSAFVKHHYLKQHTSNLSNTPLNHVPQGAPQNLNRMRFITAQRDRSRAPWQSPVKGEGVFQGKKLLVVSNTPFIDDMSIRD